MAVGIDFDFIILGTVSIAIDKLGKGISKLTLFFGKGSNFNIAFVTIPKVPSEPINKSFILYPELFLTTFPLYL